MILMDILSCRRAIITVLLVCAADVYAETFYVDSELGRDVNNGSQDRPWRTLAKVNSMPLNSGDRVLFHRGRIWRGSLVVSSSGTKERPIVFSAYGSGKNPVIFRTERFSDWKKYRRFSVADKEAVIWVGRLDGVRNSFGAVKNEKRVSKYPQWDKVQVGKMRTGTFYFPLNSGLFYFRSDKRSPGVVEIGVYREAILISNRSNIVIDAIDAWGPGGLNKKGKTSGHAAVKITGLSSNIVIKNLEISNGNSFGIRSTSETKDVKYLNLDVHDNGSTGIYMNSMGGEISNCRSYANGLIDTDNGDRGGIGVLKGGNIRIHDNKVFANGPENDNADFEIGVVQARKPVYIKRNYIHNCIQGCVQIAEGGNGSVIAYNIISGFGSSSGKPSSPGMWSGIRIGGGVSGAKDIWIYNNIIYGGESAPEDSHAGLYFHWFDESGARVVNNIFANNKGKDFLVSGSALLGKAVFSNNLFYKAWGAPIWSWRGVNIRSLSDWRLESRMGDNSIVLDPMLSDPSGKFADIQDFSPLSGSPVVDAGADVGLKKDLLGQRVPLGKAPDIGAFEFVNLQ